MLTEKEIKDYFLLMNSHAKKELGQNFLLDEECILNITNAIELKKDDRLLEIGPGLGALTGELVNKNKLYVAVEIDKKFIEFLNNAYANTNLIVENYNILKYKNYDFNKVIGNLPYYISTDILNYVIKNFTELEVAVFMVQKEFFDRITTKDKREKTPLNYFLEYLFKVEKLFTVPKSAFFPQPTIESVVFKITKNLEKDTDTARFLFKIIEISFSNRRKNINNNLKHFISDDELRKEIITKSNIELSARAEDLTLDDFVKLTTEILKVGNIKL